MLALHLTGGLTYFLKFNFLAISNESNIQMLFFIESVCEYIPKSFTQDIIITIHSDMELAG